MDISLHYTKSGDGPPLILLHGNGESSEYFQHQIPYFSSRYTVIAIDTRGHGRSARGTAPFTLRQFAVDLHDFMVSEGISKAHLLGFSDGGNIALYFALTHPEMVETLTLNGANLTPKGVKTSVQLPIVWGYRLASLFAGRNPKAAANAELFRLMVKEPSIRPDELGTLTMPTLVIAGDHDMIKETHTRLIAASIPKAELAILPGDHFIASKNPMEFNKRVFAFLCRH